MISTRIYYKTLKGNRDDPRFMAIRQTFPNSVASRESVYIPSDLAVIQGWKKNVNKEPHNSFRNQVITQQFSRGNHVLTVDGNIFTYVSKNVYFRYILDGIFHDTGYYFNLNVDPKRWENISKKIGISLKPWRKTGDYVLVLCQKSDGWTMHPRTTLEWCTDVIRNIQKHTDRPILIRPHPSDVHLKLGTFDKFSSDRVGISYSPNIIDDLKNAWCSVSYNSSPGAVSVIEGVPVFITDSIPSRSPAYPVCNTDLSMIESPSMPDREDWINSIAMSHFCIDDIYDGLLWNGVQEYLESIKK